MVKKAAKVVKSVKKVKKAYKTYKKVKKAKVSYKKIKKVKKINLKKKHSVKKTTKKKAVQTNKKRRKGNAPNRAKLNKSKKLCLGKCFTADTLVLTEDGLIPIEDIEVGDYVWSEDPKTGDITLKEVKDTFINKTDTLIFITVNGETIKTTEGHLFYVEDIGWIPANMLQKDDVLSLEDGREIPIQNVKIVEYNYYISVYNFEVDDYHTYYVSDSSVLVHNNCDEQPTRKQSFREAKRAAGIPTSAQYKTRKYVYDGSTENRTVYHYIVDGKNKYIIKHAEDKNGRGVHFHAADDSAGNPFEKGRYEQKKGHFPEDIRGYRDNKK